jgi:hypothetical protein
VDGTARSLKPGSSSASSARKRRRESRPDRVRLARKERRLSRAYVRLLFLDLVLIAVVLVGGPSDPVAPAFSGLVLGAIGAAIASIPVLVWLSWPYRQWASGRPSFYWGSIPFTDPADLVQRTGWNTRRVNTALIALAITDFVLVIVAAARG